MNWLRPVTVLKSENRELKTSILLRIRLKEDLGHVKSVGVDRRPAGVVWKLGKRCLAILQADEVLHNVAFCSFKRGQESN
ncbi:hypothetical protein AVEN_143265-1 [Araneus ventricosus]|uniref:Uncharacterized protein n=1 Tax=Araneus ventricosus TaxID=182803 RepID=A0A4Y2AG57_ARAVE|nr:hypothetical protein AVEN_143265-1 [Araneus ventricosus]